MPYSQYSALNVRRSEAVLTVTLDHPPLNLLDTPLIGDLKRFVREVATDDAVRVIVFQSAVPDFFASHVDLGFMEDVAGFGALSSEDVGHEGLLPMQHLVASVRALPQVTIAKLRGYLRGGGNEFALATDLQYAARGGTWLGQIETRMGIIPGGGGTQLLARAVGRSRALEAVLTADVVDATTAELYGWITRAVPDEELDGRVSSIAARIAALMPSQIRAAKAAIDPTTAGDALEADLHVEAAALGNVYPAPASVGEHARAWLAEGLQTVENERQLERFIDTH